MGSLDGKVAIVRHGVRDVAVGPGEGVVPVGDRLRRIGCSHLCDGPGCRRLLQRRVGLAAVGVVAGPVPERLSATGRRLGRRRGRRRGRRGPVPGPVRLRGVRRLRDPPRPLRRPRRLVPVRRRHVQLRRQYEHLRRQVPPEPLRVPLPGPLARCRRLVRLLGRRHGQPDHDREIRRGAATRPAASPCRGGPSGRGHRRHRGERRGSSRRCSPTASTRSSTARTSGRPTPTRSTSTA